MNDTTTAPFNWRAHLPVHPAADEFPLLSESELRELAEDIRRNGLQSPILIWRDTNTCRFKDYLIDGRHRLDALAMLGWLGPKRDRRHRERHWDYQHALPLTITYPENVPADQDKSIQINYELDDGDDIRNCVVSLNVHRRHLSAEDKRDLITKLLKANPEQSNRTIAKQVKADDKTVAKVRREMQSTADIPQLEKTVGADGKARKQPAKRKPKQDSSDYEAAIHAAKEALADADREAEAAFAAGYDPNVVPEEETEQERSIRGIYQDQHAWLAANPGKTLSDGFWLTDPRTDEQRAAGQPPLVVEETKEEQANRSRLNLACFETACNECIWRMNQGDLEKAISYFNEHSARWLAFHKAKADADGNESTGNATRATKLPKLNPDGVSVAGCKLIYAPAGQAGEYAPLSANPYRGCGHGCAYCYVPAVIRLSRPEFDATATPKTDYLENLKKDAAKYQALGITEQVMLSFTTDVYNPINTSLTRPVIQILRDHGLGFCVLTKGGSRALVDIDLYRPDRDAFASTLTSLDDAVSKKWERGAALPGDRIETLKKFHDRGIFTWVSLEPTLNCDAAIEIVRKTHKFVDLFKVGKANYLPKVADNIDWEDYTHRMIAVLKELGTAHYIKKDLQPYLPPNYPNPLRVPQHHDAASLVAEAA